MNLQRKIYIINATATKHGGALTILKEFLLVAGHNQDSPLFYVFSGINLDEFASDNIKIFTISTGGIGIGGIKRLFWDSFGLYTFCIRHYISPDLIISFQNTGVYFPKAIQLIYYHQPVPLFPYKWKFYRKSELNLFMYKNIYPLYVKLYVNSFTQFVVQQQCIKERLSKKMCIDINNIHVITPNCINVKDYYSENINLDKCKFNVFYPTNIEKYKNYNLLFEAIAKIKEIDPEFYKKIYLNITLNKSDKNVLKKLNYLKITDKVNLLGKISYNLVLNYYRKSDLLVFPSFIETFGLPLYEAALVGMPILAADLDYAHEVLNCYNGVKYLKYYDVNEWAAGIIQAGMAKNSFEPLKTNSSQNSWTHFLNLSENLIKQKCLKIKLS